MAVYKSVKPTYYDESLKAVVKLPKTKLTLSGAIVGELLNVETVGSYEKEKVQKIQIIEKSPFRVKPECKVYDKCGGCALQHIK